ncbi:MAG: hypothetical protein JWL77_2305 [Chthonomonadaceae bacterium]|nr:hypothetical protein [Chthonomonadaceae bacterium]
MRRPEPEPERIMTLTYPLRQFPWWIISCLLLPICALGQEHNSAQNQIKAVYAEYVHASDSKNMKALLGTVTPNFRFILADGTVHDITFFKNASRSDFDATKSVQTHRFDINSLTVKDNEATVLATETHVWTAAYEPGSLHTYQEISTSQDTLVRTTSGWKIQNSKWTSDKLTKDGVPITASGIVNHRSPVLPIRSVLAMALLFLVLVAVVLAFYVFKSSLKQRGR